MNNLFFKHLIEVSMYIHFGKGLFLLILSLSSLLFSCENFSVTIDPTCLTACLGGDIHLSSTVTGGTEPYTYSWTGPNSFSASTPDITITSATNANSGEYTLTVTDSTTPTACTATANACVFVKSISALLTASANSACAGGSIDLTVQPFNESTPYTAVLNANGTDIQTVNNITTSTYTFTDTPSVNPTVYYVTVTDSDGCIAQSNSISVNVFSPIFPVLTTAVNCDGSITVTGSGGCPGQVVSLFDGAEQIAVPQIISASGDFSLKSISLPAGTYPTGTITLQTTDCNGCPVVEEIPEFIINPTLSVTITPTNQTICEHIAYLLTANATGGTGSYTYQWYFKDSPISGATNSTYTIDDPVLSNSGIYSVIITDAAGCTASNQIFIVVDAVGVALSVSPSFVCGTSSPTSATLTASIASGAPTFTANFYQVNTPNPDILVGTLTSTSNSPIQLMLPVTPPVDPTTPSTVQYYVDVTDGNGCMTTSNIVSLNVNNPPQPTISAAALCTPQITISGTGGAGNTIAIFNGATQIAGPVTVNSSGNYGPVTTAVQSPIVNPYVLTAVATNSYGCTATSDATNSITLYPSLSVTISPASPVNVCPGCSQTLTATPGGGSGNYSYQWYFNNVIIPGATMSTYTISDAVAADAGTYKVIITDTGRVDSLVCTANASIVVNITAATLVGRDFICGATMGSVTVVVTNNQVGFPPYTFSLFQVGNPNPIAVASNISATQYTFIIGPNDINESYYVTVESSCCSITTNTLDVELITITPPLFSTVLNCDGSVTFTGTTSANVIITVSYTSGTNTIQAAVPVSSSNTGSFSITTIPLPVGTYSFTVTATDTNCCTAATTTSVTIDEPMNLTLNGPATACSGNQFIITSALSNGVAPYTYAWTGPNPNRTLPPASSLAILGATFADSGLYTLTVSDSNDPVCSTSQNKLVLVDAVGVCLQPSLANICPGEATTLTAQIIGGIAPYTVSFSDGFSEVTSNTIVTHIVTPTVTTTYSVLVSDSNGTICSTDNLTTVTVTPLAVTLQESPQAICTNQSSTLTAFIRGSTPPYTVIFSDGFTISNTNLDVVDHVVSPTESTDYSVVVDNGRGCSVVSNQVTVSVTSLIAPIITNAVGNCEGIITIIGITDPGNVVSVTYNGLEIAIPVVADAEGNFIIRTVALADGTYNLEVQVINGAPCVASTPVTVIISCSDVEIVISDPSCSTTDDSRPVITGITSNVDNIVEIFRDNVLVYTTLSDAYGNFYYTPQDPLPDGVYTFQAQTPIRSGTYAISNIITVRVNTSVKSPISADIAKKYCPLC